MLNLVTKKIAWLIIVPAIVLVTAVFSVNIPFTNAQERSRGLDEFLQELRDTDVPITVRFITPVVSSEPYWTIPASIEVEGEDTRILRSIGEIGSNYICFNEVAGGARRVDCVPFSNIASITYDMQ